MKILSKLFSKTPEDYLSKGDRYFESDSYFEARNCYEDGLQRCSSASSSGDLVKIFTEKIRSANHKLAELNLHEAEISLSRRDVLKAADHLELVKTLTYDAGLREKADKLLQLCQADDEKIQPQVKSSACGSCSGASDSSCADSPHYDGSLPPMEYYDLLIRQLPADLYQRYSVLGEDFAYGYISASQDKHEEALSAYKRCLPDSNQDIWLCEIGKVLHRLGKDNEAEQYLSRALDLNRSNTLVWYNLALLLIDGGRLDECLRILETMIREGVMPEQAMLMRGEIFEAIADFEGAINQYSILLETPFAKPAAEKLHAVLIHTERHDDAAIVFKKYLGKCCH